MGRAPFQILAFPFRPTRPGEWEFAIFRRADADWWQGIAGGGEDDETPLQAACRECNEEAGISPSAPFVALDTVASVKVTWFRDYRRWGEGRFVIPEYSFGVQVEADATFLLSHEHAEYRWLAYDAAERLLRFDSNRTALWELNLRIRSQHP